MSGLSPDFPERGSGTDLSEYTSLLRRRWLIFFFCLASGFTGGAALLRVTPPAYTSTTQVLVSPTGINDLSNQVNGRQRESLNLDTEAQVAQSAVVAEKARAKLTPSAMAEPIPAATIAVAVPPNSAVLSISATAATPASAAAHARAYADAYLQHRTEAAQREVSTQLRAFTAKLKQLNDDLSKIATTLPGLARGTAERTIAQQQQDVLSRQVYNLTVRYDTLRTVAITPGSVISEAVPPGAPSAPSPALYLGSGLMIGMLAGAGAAFARDRLDTRLRTARDVERLTGVPVIAGPSGVPAGRDPDTPQELASTLLAARPGGHLLIRPVGADHEARQLADALARPLDPTRVLTGEGLHDLAHADSAVLLVALRGVPAREVNAAAQALRRAGARLIGAVVVRPARRRARRTRRDSPPNSDWPTDPTSSDRPTRRKGRSDRPTGRTERPDRPAEPMESPGADAHFDRPARRTPPRDQPAGRTDWPAESMQSTGFAEAPGPGSAHSDGPARRTPPRDQPAGRTDWPAESMESTGFAEAPGAGAHFDRPGGRTPPPGQPAGRTGRSDWPADPASYSDRPGGRTAHTDRLTGHAGRPGDSTESAGFAEAPGASARSDRGAALGEQPGGRTGHSDRPADPTARPDRPAEPMESAGFAVPAGPFGPARPAQAGQPAGAPRSPSAAVPTPPSRTASPEEQQALAAQLTTARSRSGRDRAHGVPQAPGGADEWPVPPRPQTGEGAPVAPGEVARARRDAGPGPEGLGKLVVPAPGKARPGRPAAEDGTTTGTHATEALITSPLQQLNDAAPRWAAPPDPLDGPSPSPSPSPSPTHRPTRSGSRWADPHDEPRTGPKWGDLSAPDHPSTPADPAPETWDDALSPSPRSWGDRASRGDDRQDVDPPPPAAPRRTSPPYPPTRKDPDERDDRPAPRNALQSWLEDSDPPDPWRET
ncbi:hypothetical protein DP939_19720 [Spongiactinospora rosea]|uniref:Polysaccharide chain length determinant N-terminal domain-containing protein n=1 Tax=Spongiactinospora rosea TaxID=2248750 RepID=A0A366LXK7_9ACTN|nr:Wzz/FepE/Etk N-terminal domain-containing protein [Spongiactinospora rosea]RBQ18706.1 hypothetical protein DP939_19720 [Spongiactinospora rosea]